VSYSASSAAVAKPVGVECALVEADGIEVDGMLDDWSGIDARDTGSDDAGFEIRCAQSEDRLFLALTVRDDSVIRTSKNAKRRDQDFLALSIGAGGAWSRLKVFPGTRGYEPIYTWRGGKVKAPAAVADSLQPNGWAVELGVPLTQLARWGRGTPRLRFAIDYVDRDDGKNKGRVKQTGTIRFAGSTAVYLSFMEQVRLSYKDKLIDTLVNIDGARGVERVIVAGKVVGVITDEYRYLTLPVQSASDVHKVKVVDLAGEGRASIVTHYREHGNGGSRDVLAVWNLQADGSFARSLAVEVRKQMGNNSLTANWRLQKRKGKRARGYELIVEAGEVVGWDEDSFDDVPPEDMQPIITPWAEETSATFHFEGDQAIGG
jgi:hypothetical protein